MVQNLRKSPGVFILSISSIKVITRYRNLFKLNNFYRLLVYGYQHVKRNDDNHLGSIYKDITVKIKDDISSL